MDEEELGGLERRMLTVIKTHLVIERRAVYRYFGQCLFSPCGVWEPSQAIQSSDSARHHASRRDGRACTHCLEDVVQVFCFMRLPRFTRDVGVIACRLLLLTWYFSGPGASFLFWPT